VTGQPPEKKAKGTRGEGTSGQPPEHAAKTLPGDEELTRLRSQDGVYDALVRNMVWSFESKGLAIRHPQPGESPSLEVDGCLPSLAAESERATFILEFATAAMLQHPHLTVRLQALQKIVWARRWLVVPSDEWAEARALVANRHLNWQVIVGDR